MRTRALFGRLAAASVLVAGLLVQAEGPRARAEDGGARAWTLAFSDEFDGTALDEAKWDNGFGWGVRSEGTYGYCDPTQNVVGGGALTQRIERRPQGGKPWSVGCLNTKDRFSQVHGYWEARMWVAGCHGARGAFWAKPADESWPPELDIVEIHGDEPTTSRHTIRWRDGAGPVERRRVSSPGPDFTAGYHVFGAHWSPEGTVWYVDGVERGRTGEGAAAMGGSGPFYATLNAQVYRPDSDCGTGPGTTHQYVDYVRIWEPGPSGAVGPEPGPDPASPPQPVGPAGCGVPTLGSEDLPGLPHGISEVSGLAASRVHPGVAWMIRDSGNAPSVYALRLGRDGAPDVDEFPVTGAVNRDWEEIVATTGPEGRGRLWVLESGQSGGRDRRIYEILEPDPDGDRHAPVLGRYRYAYPDLGPINTEAAFAFDGDLVLVTKTSPGRVYRFRQTLSERRVNRPSFVGELRGADNVSVVRVSEDQRTLVTASHKQALVYESRRARPSNPKDSTPLRDLIAGAPVGGASLGPGAAVEAGDWFPRGTCALVLVSEHRGVQRLRLTDVDPGRK